MNKQRGTRCPCGSGESYSDCCGPLHGGVLPAATAEALMRSRYSAYVLRDAPYLLKTWHASTRPKSLDLSDDVRWLGLEIVGRNRGGPFDSQGQVTFVAHYAVDGKRGEQGESSLFAREDGFWLYLGPVGGSPRRTRPGGEPGDGPV